MAPAAVEGRPARRRPPPRPFPSSGRSRGLSRTWRLLALALAASLGATVWAAAPVVESPPATTPAPAAAEEADGLATLYYQLQLLQDDVRRLQGIVEEQNHRLDRLVQDQRDRYIELDRRLVELGTPAAPADSAAGATPTGFGTSPGATTEAGAYNAAFAVVKGASNLVPSERLAAYAEALTAFQALIAQYPAGEFTPNAYYWSGEIHLYTEALELARQAFVQVVTLFADHAKVPDALYKLGVVYHRLGDNQRALQYLDRVAAEHPSHTAADLARNYAAELR